MFFNTAAGDYSWAGGRYMQLTANADNTFVWGNATSAVSIGTADAFLIFPNATGATGRVGIGTDAPTAKLTVGAGTPSVITDAGTGTVFITSDLEIGGEAYKPGGGSWASASDKRLKTHINALTGALDKITRLGGVTYEWIHPENHGHLSGTQTGLIAQDVETIFPEWVNEVDATGQDRELIPEGEKVKTLKFPHDFNAYIIEAIKELKVENDVLKAENDALMARLSALEEKVCGNTPVHDVNRIR